jgi:hypothetical protein
MLEDFIDIIDGFDWDEGNNIKNYSKHKVSLNEAEEMFFNKPLIVLDDIKHSNSEKRYLALGKTNDSRKVFCVFTLRKNKIRIISIRDMNKKEREFYEKNSKTKKNSKI